MKKAGKRIAPKVFYTFSTIEKVLTHNEIKKSRPYFNASLVGTVMKGLELELTEELPNVPIYFENTVTYENESATKTIGPYYLKEKPEYNADSKTYSHILYDNFILGMVDYKPITISYPTTVLAFFKKFCEERGLTTNIDSLPNGNRIIPYDIYRDIGFTDRDVFTDIGQATATLFKINENNVEKCSFDTIPIIINDDILKNKNIVLGEHFGPINSIILSRSADSDFIYKRDETVSKWNEFKICDNILMNDNNRVDYLEELYANLYGIEYDIFDLELVGYGGFEPLQKIEIETNGKSYYSYIFNNEEIFTQGYEENIHTDMPDETDPIYAISDKTDRRIKETYLIVEKQNQKIEAAVTNSEKALSQTTNLTIELGKIQGLISESVDTTKSSEGVGTIALENINQSEPVMLQIYPTTEDISYLYPADNLYPSDDLFLLSRKVIFENTSTKEKVEYELPCDLLICDGTYDEFTLDLKNRKCTVSKKVGVNENGENYVLTQSVTKEFDYPTIKLMDGNYKIYLLSFNTAHIFCRLMSKNIYTEQFATNISLESAIEQLRDSITLRINETLSNYSTTTEMNAAITIKATEINNSVNLKITDLNNEVNEISGSLDLKIDKENLCSILSGRADDISFTGNRFSWTSTNSSLTKDGKLTVKAGDVGGWDINNSGLSKGSFFIHNNGYSNIYTYADIIVIRNYLLNKISLTAEDIKHYDLNNDGEVDSADLLLMRQKILNI